MPTCRQFCPLTGKMWRSYGRFDNFLPPLTVWFRCPKMGTSGDEPQRGTRPRGPIQVPRIGTTAMQPLGAGRFTSEDGFPRIWTWSARDFDPPITRLGLATWVGYAGRLGSGLGVCSASLRSRPRSRSIFADCMGYVGGRARRRPTGATRVGDGGSCADVTGTRPTDHDGWSGPLACSPRSPGGQDGARAGVSGVPTGSGRGNLNGVDQ